MVLVTIIMTQTPSMLPKIFGDNWTQFINEWCAGVTPPIDESTTIEALNHLNELWPDYVNKIITNPNRGLLIICPAIHYGLILKSCRSLVGFEKVFNRVKAAEKSAFSELKFAHQLCLNGITPELEPSLNGKVLDTKIIFNNREIFFEVTSHETSDAIKNIRSDIEQFAQKILDDFPSKRIEVFLTQDITTDIQEAVIDVLKNTDQTNIKIELPDVAIITKHDEPFDLVTTPLIEKQATDAVLGAAKSNVTPDLKTLAIVRLCITDARAKRLLYAESHHFSKDHINILVMDVTSVTGGMKKWIEIISKCLQPNQNRRFSAVIFFSEGFYIDVNNTKQEWKYVNNEHTYHKVPDGLLNIITGQN